MKKVAKFGIVALLLVGLVGSAFAFGGMGFGSEAARVALEAGDYGAWKEAMAAELTEERFNQMRERNQQMQEKMAQMDEKRSKIDAAIEAGDYEAWKEAVQDFPHEAVMTKLITEENFDKFVEMHNAMKSGDYEGAKEIAQELGLKRPFKGSGFGKRGMIARGRFGPMMDSEIS